VDHQHIEQAVGHVNHLLEMHAGDADVAAVGDEAGHALRLPPFAVHRDGVLHRLGGAHRLHR
jgi:hypothetical protein